MRLIIHQSDIAGLVVNWSIELSEFGLSFEPQRAIKGQTLADFAAEITPANLVSFVWKIFIDGASSAKLKGVGIIVESPDGYTIEQAIEIRFAVTNNQAGYEALIAALEFPAGMGAEDIHIYNDSQLVVQHMKGEFEVKEPTILKYVERAKTILRHHIKSAKLTHVLWAQNSKVDALAKLASKLDARGRSSIIQTVLERPSIEKASILTTQVTPD